MGFGQSAAGSALHDYRNDFGAALDALIRGEYPNDPVPTQSIV